MATLIPLGSQCSWITPFLLLAKPTLGKGSYVVTASDFKGRTFKVVGASARVVFVFAERLFAVLHLLTSFDGVHTLYLPRQSPPSLSFSPLLGKKKKRNRMFMEPFTCQELLGTVISFHGPSRPSRLAVLIAVFTEAPRG